MKNGFTEVYPFATENVKEYLQRMNLKDTSILTTGSSLDQALNAIVLGAKKITVLDINPNTPKFFELKKKIILEKDKKEIYTLLTTKSNFPADLPISNDILKKQQVFEINNYLSNEESYQLLKSNLEQADINFVTGDIFNLPKEIKQEKYDRIVFSNILQYLEYFTKTKPKALSLLKDNFPIWESLLNPEGIMQLLYLYSYTYQDIFKDNHPILTYNLKEIYKTLYGYKLSIEWIKGITPNTKDAIVTYTKRRTIK